MIASLLALALGAAPVAVDGADATIAIARIDRMDKVLAFLERAGRHAILLRPSSWRGEIHPVLALDPTRVDSIAGMGIDTEGGMTLSIFDEGRVACVQVKDAAKYEQASQARLGQLGTVERVRRSGATFALALVRNTAVAGYVTKGSLSCATASGRTEQLLQRALKAIDRGPRTPPWGSVAEDEVVIHLAQGLTTRLSGTPDMLEARSRGELGNLLALKPAGLSPYGGIAPSGLFFLRARVAPPGVRRALVRLGAQLLHACSVCERDVVAALMSELETALTGELMFRVDRVNAPPGGMTSDTSYAFAVKYALLAEVSRPDVASKALEGLMKLGAVRVAPDRYSVTPPNARAGALILGLSGPHLYASNDERALEASLGAVAKAPTPARLEHSAAAVIDPTLVARALSQLSILDLLASKDMAPLVVLATEIGPLFARSERIEGWIDGEGSSQRGFLRWRLALDPPDAARRQGVEK